MTEDTETDDPEQNVAEDRDGSVERRRRPDPVAEALGDDELITSPEPVTAAYSKTEDLYDVSTWEVRSRLDRLSVKIYDTLTDDPRRTLIALVTVLLALQVAVLLYILLFVPEFGFFALLSIIPAGLITAYIWYRFSTPRKRLKPILATFILSMVLTGGAALSNEAFNALSFLVPFVGGTLFFFLVVAPGEEIVKLLAVRLYAYRSDDFTRVIDGAIFGAVAGLGFILASQFLGTVPVSVVGASGAIFAILGVLTVLNPGLKIYLYFFIPMPLWLFTLGFALLSVVFFLSPGTASSLGQGNVAHLAHLLGLVIGLGYGKHVQGQQRVPDRLQFGGPGGPGGPGRRGGGRGPF